MNKLEIKSNFRTLRVLKNKNKENKRIMKLRSFMMDNFKSLEYIFTDYTPSSLETIYSEKIDYDKNGNQVFYTDSVEYLTDETLRIVWKRKNSREKSIEYTLSQGEIIGEYSTHPKHPNNF
jgi:hypothetical protein|nr:MAG TPA: hypothetical protein [Caudoviricetes sp.]